MKDAALLKPFFEWIAQERKHALEVAAAAFAEASA